MSIYYKYIYVCAYVISTYKYICIYIYLSYHDQDGKWVKLIENDNVWNVEVWKHSFVLFKKYE